MLCSFYIDLHKYRTNVVIGKNLIEWPRVNCTLNLFANGVLTWPSENVSLECKFRSTAPSGDVNSASKSNSVKDNSCKGVERIRTELKIESTFQSQRHYE